MIAATYLGIKILRKRARVYQIDGVSDRVFGSTKSAKRAIRVISDRDWREKVQRADEARRKAMNI